MLTNEQRKKESEVAQLYPTLCNPMDYSPPGFSIHGILQARTLERVAIFFSRGSSQPRYWTRVSHTAGRHFNLWATREVQQMNKVVFKTALFIKTYRCGLQDVACQTPTYTVARFNLNWIHLTFNMSFLVGSIMEITLTHPGWWAYMRTGISEFCPHNKGCKKRLLESLPSSGAVDGISVHTVFGWCCWLLTRRI